MAETKKLPLRVVGKGANADDERIKVRIDESRYPDLITALRAYFEDNMDVDRITVRVLGK